MSSLKMTFSLASLVLILGLVFATAPAMAQAIDQIADLGETLGTVDKAAAPIAALTPADNANVDPLNDAVRIPPGGYLILTSAAVTDAFLGGLDADETDKVQVLVWGNMPNLEDLFFEGGTILLRRTKLTAADGNKIDHDGDDDGQDEDGVDLELAITDKPDAVINDKKKDEKAGVVVTPADGAAATDWRDIGVRDLVITEIMWSRDLGLVGVGEAEFNHQWIEIYNPLGTTFILENVVLHVKGEVKGQDAINADANFIKLDRASNEVGRGWDITGLGQSGNTTSDPTENFVSMYRAQRGKDGEARGSWGKSSEVYFTTAGAGEVDSFNNVGTPGDVERARRTTAAESGDPPLTPFIINEFSTAGDWVEIKNVTDAVASLKNYQLSQVTKSGTDALKVSFKDKDWKVPGGGVILIISGTKDSTISEDLDESVFAGGINVAEAAADREKKGSQVLYWHPGEFTIDHGSSLLVLRKNHDGKHLKTANEIVDITGGGSFGNTDGTTNYWPLIKDGGAHKETVKTDGQDPAKDKSFDDDTVYRRNKADKYRDAETWVNVGFTGLGYKRNAKDGTKNGGTPGYDNATVKGDGVDAIAAVEISEIMYATGDRGLTQWIELRNTSDTVGVNLGSWQLSIVNHHEMMDDAGMMVDWDDGEFAEDVELEGIIPPNQTYLIVGRETGRDTTELPEHRIKSVGLKRTESLLNPYGFQLTLIAKRGEVAAKQESVDEAGNLKPAPAGARRSDARAFNDDVAWNLPSGISEDGDRVSIVRSPDATDATEEGAWLLYTMTEQYDAILDDTYYGHDSDISSPGHNYGGALPVSLSKFRPERMKDTGEIVVRWITESELNNAGFNILRSETRDGVFTKLNTKLIAGQGTTSERTIYGFTDTSAKPNVVYYYQIQDVSLDGQVQTLRTTHLRGNVTAAGKLTTIWAEIKALQ